MAQKIKGITIEIGGETRALDKALEDVNKKTRDLQSELRSVERLLKLDPKNTELLAQKQKLLAEQVENSREKLERLRAAQEKVEEAFRKGEIGEEQYRHFQRQVINAEQELKKFEKQLRETGITVEQVGKKLGDAGKKMTDLGKNLSMKVTAPIAGLGTVATKAAIDFESAFAGVRKTVDATEEEFAQLEKGIREMSQRMPASATDIAAVAEAAGQLGIETDNILKFTETMIGLGEATNLTAEEGATQFARFANIVGMSQQDFDRLGSAVVALGNSFATTEAEIVAMGMRLAGQGAQIGMTEAQIMALAAAMSSVGIEAEAGGTAMSTTLKKMQTAVSLAGEDLDKFASVARMSASEFAKAFQEDPSAALQAFVDGLAASSAEGENLTLILNDLGISGIRESDTLLRLAGANDVLREALETSTTAWEENAALQEEVAQRYATTESQLQMFKNQVTDLGIDIGKILVPALMAFVDMLRPVVDWLKSLSPEAQKVIVIIAGLAAAIGPLLVVLGMLASSISAIIAIAPTLGAAFTALTGPIGIAIAAVAALIAIGVALYKNWDEVKAFAEKTWNAIKNFFSNTLNNIKNTVSTKFREMVQAIRDRMEEIQQKIRGTWNNITGFLKGINLFNIGRDIMQGLLDGISNMARAIYDKVREIADSVKNTIKSALRISSPSRVMMELGEFTAEGFALGLEQAIRNIKTSAAEMVRATIPAQGALPTSTTSITTQQVVQSVSLAGMFAGANFYVRNDTDIQRIARELFNLQQQAARGRGLVR